MALIWAARERALSAGHHEIRTADTAAHSGVRGGGEDAAGHEGGLEVAVPAFDQTLGLRVVPLEPMQRGRQRAGERTHALRVPLPPTDASLVVPDQPPRHPPEQLQQHPHPHATGRPWTRARSTSVRRPWKVRRAIRLGHEDLPAVGDLDISTACGGPLQVNHPDRSVTNLLAEDNERTIDPTAIAGRVDDIADRDMAPEPQFAK